MECAAEQIKHRHEKVGLCLRNNRKYRKWNLFYACEIIICQCHLGLSFDFLKYHTNNALKNNRANIRICSLPYVESTPAFGRNTFWIFTENPVNFNTSLWYSWSIYDIYAARCWITGKHFWEQKLGKIFFLITGL